MDKKRSVLNVGISIISKFLLMFSGLFVRRLLIQHIGNDVNGLNSLYASIIGMLSVAELGVGSAIVFSMYHPIVHGEKDQVAALYRLYRSLYLKIGLIITIAGLAVTPFLPRFISDYDQLNINVYLAFLLTLAATVITYLYSAKTSLIEAHKNDYIVTGIMTVSRLITYALQIAAILLFESYTAFLICQIIETLIVWSLTEIVIRRDYDDIIHIRAKVDQKTRGVIVRSIKAMFMHKIGAILVNTIDSMIISAFIGVAALGLYSNYNLIALEVSGTIGLFFSSLTSVVGHLYAAGDPEETKKYFDRFYFLNFLLGFVFFLGYYAIADNLVSLCFGQGLKVSRTVVFILTLHIFTKFMRNTSLLFRDASGTFYNDRWKPLAEGLSNLILSLLFVRLFPPEYSMAGVIAATIVTNLLICHTVEPYVVFRYALGKSPREFYIRNYGYITLFTLTLLCMTWILRPVSNDVLSVLINGCLSVLVSMAVLGCLALFDKDFRAEVKRLLGAAVSRIHHLLQH